MARNCTICGKPITLVPSAAERAKKYDGTPAQYEAMFTAHASCVVNKRSRESLELIQRITQESKT